MSLASSAGAAYLSSVVTREGTRRHKRWSPGFPTEEQKHWPGDVCGAGGAPRQAELLVREEPKASHRQLAAGP